MKNDQKRAERAFRRRRESAETSSRNTPRSSMSDEGAEEEQNDEQMDAVGSGGMKRKAEDTSETEPWK